MTPETLASPETDVETFNAPWPTVLFDMKDFVDLWFLARKHRAATVRVFISRSRVPPAQLQPHMREFKAALGTIPHCRIEFKATGEPVHRIEIEYRKGTP